jgi:hypothetical protein
MSDMLWTLTPRTCACTGPELGSAHFADPPPASWAGELRAEQGSSLIPETVIGP